MNNKQDMIDSVNQGLNNAEQYAKTYGKVRAYHYLIGYISTVMDIYSEE